MKVKLETACEWEGKRREAGSVIEVPAEVAEKNPWMKPTDDPLKDAEPTKADKKAAE